MKWNLQEIQRLVEMQMTLGRILRIDGELRRSNGRWQIPLVLHGLFAFGMSQAVFSPPNDAVILIVLASWIACGVALECWLRFLLHYEVQLLPGAVRMKKWWCDELLIEPEVVSGRISWSNVIHLRAGERQARIDLDWFQNRQDRAAIVEHCSQFLAAEQQAAHGHEWAKRYNQLLSPPKPPKRPTAREMLRTIGITYVICLAILIACLEPAIAQGLTNEGLSFRWCYVVITGVCVMFSGLLAVGMSRPVAVGTNLAPPR